MPTTNPYILQVVGGTQIGPGGTVTVTLRASGSQVFKGFLLQARRVGQTAPYGTWVGLPANTRVTTCQVAGDTATHLNTRSKTSLTFTWQAPNTNTGTVEFYATVVQSYTIFWAPLRSAQITVSGSSSGGNACSSNPCQNNGVCNPLGTSGFQCSCQQGFTGSVCTTPTTGSAVCSPNPCQNGGSCVVTGASSYRCNCLTGSSGSVCQIIAQGNACSSNPCLNSGRCSVVDSTYVCSCQSGYTGLQCQTSPVPSPVCSPNPCQNGGSCVVTGVSSYRCNCLTGTSGSVCQTIAQGNACSSSPCFNGGQCSVTGGGSSYVCACQAGYTGLQCQTRNPDPVCSPNPCQNGGSCVVTGASSYRCNCLTGTSGTVCQTIAQGSVCSPNPCQNGGSCVVTGVTSYRCNCLTGTSGSVCQTITQGSVCSPNPCQNGGSCVVTGASSHRCNCLTGTSGSLCQTITPGSSTPCSQNLCLYGSTCQLLSSNSFQCVCVYGTSGTFCGNLDNACGSSPCLNGGQCTVVGTSYQCGCQTGFLGQQCQIRETSCSSNPCQNGGQCSVSAGSAFTCTCPIEYRGSVCQNTACFSNPCQNGGQCSSLSGGYSYQCVCLSGYTGTRCEVRNPCSPNPCINGGSCTSPNVNTFQCECTTGWTGTDCSTRSDAVCAQSNLCLNGGTCQPNNGGSFICQCAQGFDGINCERQISRCLPNPCVNGGTCRISGSAFTCSCPTGYVGITCLFPDLCTPNPCNRGACSQSLGQSAYTCTCNAGYKGELCNVQALCNPNPCVNGQCTQNDLTLSFSCQCNLGFLGTTCAQERIGPCVAVPCLNGAMCLENPDKINFECACAIGYGGTLCEEAILPVFQNCPMFEIVIVKLDEAENYSTVDMGITAIVPDSPPPTLEVITGPSIPGRVTYSEEFRTGVEVVIKATSQVGMTAECHFILILFDDQMPSVQCPNDVIKVTYAASDIVEWEPATATDNLAQPSEITLSYSMNSGTIFYSNVDPLPRTVTVTATDTFGNKGICKFNVTLIRPPNSPSPIFRNCEDGETFTYHLRSNTNVAYVSMEAIEAVDFLGNPAFIRQVEGPRIDLPGDLTYNSIYREGQKFVYQAIDPGTNQTRICTFYIKLLDSEPPKLDCPANIADRTTASTKAIFWNQAEVTDNLGLPEGATISYAPKNGTAFEANENGWSYVVTASTTDTFSNVGECEFSVTLYKFDIVCETFPGLANGSSDCSVALDGRMECRVSCDDGFFYAPADNRFKCLITSTKAIWNPSPNIFNLCSRPTAGSSISKTVTAVYPFDSSTCDATNKVFVSNIETSIQTSLREYQMCERGYARACTPGSVTSRCGVVSSTSRKRRRRAFTDLTVDIEIEAPAAFTGGSSLSEVKKDVDDLARDIMRLIDDKILTLMINSDIVARISSQVSLEYKWTCPDGYSSVTGGCVACPAGTFFNYTSRECLFCRRGYYQDQPKKGGCIPCPSGHNTDQMGSQQESDCVSNTAQLVQEWTPLLIAVVVIAILLFVILIIGIMCICTCIPSSKKKHYREKDLDGSLSNLKYLNKAYEEDYEKSRSRGLHRLTTKRQTSPSRSSTATGYITMSTSRGSHHQGDMISIDSDEYRQDVHDGQTTHYNHGNNRKRDSGESFGHVSLATLASNNRGAFRPPSPQQSSVSDSQMRRELPDTGL
ncbi:uncharacterized protein LOC117296026 isoform X3 [Asterias rubens]|uniref:uncharacterized protein LOC117296026 isoform X3 n=1 Tax=Asterias rubens TaxID=7604 RepID=UPI001455D562|nr:uncharacterized protein LOC117296026 isoform X3 [Asterias rubens]